MAGDTVIFERSKQQQNILDIIQCLPLYPGEFDPKAYIDWELKVDNEFDEHDLSEKQMIYIASNILTENALLEWKYICRHNIIPQTWKEFKIHFRDAYIPAYYVDHLLTKLEKLKQGSRTVKQYYHDFKICIMFGGLDECMEDVMNRFMRGLNSEIRNLLIGKSYCYIGQLFCLALHAEKEILSFVNTCKNDVTHSVQTLSTLHANKEQRIVEPAADSTFSQDELLVVSYDKEDLCANTSFTHIPELMNKCDIFGLEPYECAVDNPSHPITCVQDELKLLSSLNTLGYIEFNILCNLNCLKEKVQLDSNLPSLNHCSLHAIGKNDIKGEYLVHKVYICSNLKYPFGLQYHEQIGGCINTNNILQSFSSFSLMQQDQPEEREHCLLCPCSIVVAPCSNNKASTFECRWSKSRTTCSQEGENDVDITRMDTPTCNKHTWKVWRTKEVDWGPSLSLPNVLHQATTSLLVQGKKESMSNTFWRLDSDCRKAPTYDGHHGRIRTRIGTFKYFVESL